MTINPYESPTSVVTRGRSNYHSISSLATIVTALFLLNAAGDLLMRWGVRPAYLYFEPRLGREDIEPLFMAMIGLSLVKVLLYPAGLIVFFMFLYRAHRNTRVLGAIPLKYSASWAIASFFMPFVNLYVPDEAVCDIYRCQYPDDESQRLPSRSTTLVLWWWITNLVWWATVLIAQLLFGLVPFHVSYFLYQLAPFLYAVTSVLAVLWIRELASRQSRLYSKRISADALE